MARVLVTGGSGFIGSHVVRALVADGHAVRVLDLVAGDEPDVDLVVGDVRDADVVRRALTGVDVVAHHAATVGMGTDLQDLPRYVSHNDLGTAVLLAGMHERELRRLVLASSMVVYGEGAYSCPQHGAVPAAPRREIDLVARRFEPPCPVCGEQLEPGLVTEDAPLDPRSVYAATKVAQEHLVRAWASAAGASAALLRYHNVYGPGLPRDTPYAGVAAIFRSAATAGRAPRVFEDGRQRRDFVHVRDVARANAAAVRALLENGLVEPVRPVNVASGTPRTVLDVAAGIADALGAPAPEVTGEYRAGDVRHVTASCDRLRDELGWEPVESFTDGVAELALEDVTTA